MRYGPTLRVEREGMLALQVWLPRALIRTVRLAAVKRELTTSELVRGFILTGLDRIERKEKTQ
jgi:hypothetical protein